MDNLRRAHHNAQRGKSFYEEVKRVNKNEDYYLSRLQQMLLAKTFKNSKYEIFHKVDRGKDREIFKLPYFPDRILHHAILQVVEPIWKKTLIANTFQSIKGRGIHYGFHRVRKAIQDGEKYYCLKFDIKKFYPSIDNQILKSILRRKIKDENVLWLLDEVIDSTRGVPIGNYLSQYYGNMYLAYFDHWIKEKIKIHHYFRYCDDIVILHPDKDFLQYLFVKIEYYLEKNLRLTVKKNYQVFPVSKRRVDFLGFQFDSRKIYLRKSIAKKFKRNVSRVRTGNVENPRSVIMSYKGWTQTARAFDLWNKHIDNEIKSIIKLNPKAA